MADRNPGKLAAIGILCVWVLFSGRVIASNSAADPDELERTWLSATVNMPGEHINDAVPHTTPYSRVVRATMGDQMIHN
jgi:hypothetical protein